MLARALLHHDPRFTRASWRARAVYLLALEHQDAAGDLVAPPGCSAADAVAALAHCSMDEAIASIAEMVAAGLVAAGDDRLALLVGSVRGRRGGKTSAERMRDLRAARRAPPPRDDGDGAPSLDPSHVTGSDASRAVTVTANVTGIVTGENGENTDEAATCDGAVAFAAVTSPGANPCPPSPPLSLPLASPSLSPTPSSPSGSTRPREVVPAQGELIPGAAAVAPAPKPSRKPRPARPDVLPASGTLAHQVHAALVADPVLGATTRRPGEFATRLVQPGAYPGVDVLAEVLRCGAWASTAKREVKDGNATLANWLAEAAARVARRGAPAPVATLARPTQRGFTPAATGADFDRERGGPPADTTRPIQHAWRGGAAPERKASGE